jgi:hypothetical protein
VTTALHLELFRHSGLATRQLKKLQRHRLQQLSQQRLQREQLQHLRQLQQEQHLSQPRRLPQLIAVQQIRVIA